jgi:hypothetical protein
MFRQAVWTCCHIFSGARVSEALEPGYELSWLIYVDKCCVSTYGLNGLHERRERSGEAVLHVGPAPKTAAIRSQDRACDSLYPIQPMTLGKHRVRSLAV